MWALRDRLNDAMSCDSLIMIRIYLKQFSVDMLLLNAVLKLADGRAVLNMNSYLNFTYFIAFYLIAYIFFILGDQIPSISVTEANMLQHGDNITVFCNITHPSWRSELKRISWLKNGVVQQSVRNPDPYSPLPLVIKNAAARDGGKYSCVLEVWLRRIRSYNVSDSVMITSEYTMSLW